MKRDTALARNAQGSMQTQPLTETFDRKTSAIIFRSREQFGGLSNMHGGYALVVAGLRFQSSETLYQACRFPYLPRLQQLVMEERTAWDAKQLSILYKYWSRRDWDEVRVLIMAWCLRLKLAQHPERFGALLRSTGDMPIVELSFRDDFWGAKPQPPSGDQLVGVNMLGRLLMKLRADLLANEAEALRPTPPLVADLLLLGRLAE